MTVTQAKTTRLKNKITLPFLIINLLIHHYQRVSDVTFLRSKLCLLVIFSKSFASSCIRSWISLSWPCEQKQQNYSGFQISHKDGLVSSHLLLCL